MYGGGERKSDGECLYWQNEVMVALGRKKKLPVVVLGYVVLTVVTQSSGVVEIMVMLVDLVRGH